jgi:hypothetical protein
MARPRGVSVGRAWGVFLKDGTTLRMTGKMPVLLVGVEKEEELPIKSKSDIPDPRVPL